MSNGRATVPGGAAKQVEWALARTVIVARAGLLASVALDARTLFSQYRRPRLAAVACASVLGHAIWASRRTWRNRTAADRVVGITEVPTGVFALLADAVSAGRPADQTRARLGLGYLGFLGAAAASEIESADVLRPHVAVLIGASAVGAFRRFVPGPGGVSVLLGDTMVTSSGLVARSVVGDLRSQAVRRDVFHERSRRSAGELASNRERHRQYRIVHDSVLQTLEIIAGQWGIEDRVLLERVDFDIARLEELIAGGGALPAAPLQQLANDLLAESKRRGLHVELDVATELRGLTTPNCQGLTEAIREALMNVVKHAGVARASVHIRSTGGSIEATVADAGAGFDPNIRHEGFGVAHSILGRITELGGTTTIESAPGRGTIIVLTCAPMNESPRWPARQRETPPSSLAV